MTELNPTEQNSTTKKPSSARYFIRMVVTVLVHLAILLISAGRLDWINAWVFSGLYLVLMLVYLTLMLKVNPELLAERKKFVKKDTKKFDRVFFSLWLPLSYIILIVSGLDAARFGWSQMPFFLSVAGFAVFILAFAFSLWAISVNRHFETTVRIQTDRDHKVCSSGPYRFIRHPGYLSMIVTSIATPLFLGSWYGLYPAAAAVLAVLFRTSLEDRTLQKELPGYAEFSTQTRYRLIPMIW